MMPNFPWWQLFVGSLIRKPTLIIQQKEHSFIHSHSILQSLSFMFAEACKAQGDFSLMIIFFYRNEKKLISRFHVLQSQFEGARSILIRNVGLLLPTVEIKSPKLQ